MDNKLLRPEGLQQFKNGSQWEVRQDNLYTQTNMPAVGKILYSRTGEK